MQRRNVRGESSVRGGATSPPLAHPIPHHPARSPDIASQSFDEDRPQLSKPSRNISNASGPAADYQRFTSPPPAQLQVNGQPQAPPTFGVPQQPVNGYVGGQAYAQPAGPQQYRGFGQQQGQVAGPAGGQQVPWAGNAWANDATAQMGMQFGKSAVAAGQDYVERNFVRHLPLQHLRHSFNVDNVYVVSKLRLVLFPWRHKPWSRLVKRSEATGQPEGYKPAREDLNSPDLYIPTMALVTYILLSGVVAGSQSRFHPEQLGLTASKSSGIVLLEFLIIKLGCYLLDIGGEGTVVDLLSYSGYKFVGIVVVLLGGLLGLKGWTSLLLFIYVFAANGFFLLRSLRYVVLPDPALQQPANDPRFGNAIAPGGGQHVSHTQRGRRIRFLFAIAASQLFSMWWLGRV